MLGFLAENAIRPFVLGRNYALNIIMCSNVLSEDDLKMKGFGSTTLRLKRSAKNKALECFTLVSLLHRHGKQKFHKTPVS
jgi:hypothetical protein